MMRPGTFAEGGSIMTLILSGEARLRDRRGMGMCWKAEAADKQRHSVSARHAHMLFRLLPMWARVAVACDG